MGEQAHQQLKEELGLDHCECRNWQALHHHALMSLLALAFLQHLRLQKKSATGQTSHLPASNLHDAVSQAAAYPAQAGAAARTLTPRHTPRHHRSLPGRPPPVPSLQARRALSP